MLKLTSTQGIRGPEVPIKPAEVAERPTFSAEQMDVCLIVGAVKRAGRVVGMVIRDADGNLWHTLPKEANCSDI